MIYGRFIVYELEQEKRFFTALGLEERRWQQKAADPRYLEGLVLHFDLI